MSSAKRDSGTIHLFSPRLGFSNFLYAINSDELKVSRFTIRYKYEHYSAVTTVLTSQRNGTNEIRDHSKTTGILLRVSRRHHLAGVSVECAICQSAHRNGNPTALQVRRGSHRERNPASVARNCRKRFRRRSRFGHRGYR